MILSAEREGTIWPSRTGGLRPGLELVDDPGLLAEVAGLVEWPVVLMGRIDEAFLDLPPEVLQTSMREHQKFFSVRNPKSGRIERFVTVANVETADDGATILAGNPGCSPPGSPTPGSSGRTTCAPSARSGSRAWRKSSRP